MSLTGQVSGTRSDKMEGNKAIWGEVYGYSEITYG
jgi:hypothetical protein